MGTGTTDAELRGPGDGLPSTVTATAVSGHRMVYRVVGRDGRGRLRTSQWDAVHSQDCPCWSSSSPWEWAEPMVDR